jgi:hypothetical protein
LNGNLQGTRIGVDRRWTSEGVDAAAAKVSRTPCVLPPILARKFMGAGEALQRVTEWHRRHPML